MHERCAHLPARGAPHRRLRYRGADAPRPSAPSQHLLSWMIDQRFVAVGTTFALSPRVACRMHPAIAEAQAAPLDHLPARTKTSGQAPDNEARQPGPSWLTGFFCFRFRKRFTNDEKTRHVRNCRDGRCSTAIRRDTAWRPAFLQDA